MSVLRDLYFPMHMDPWSYICSHLLSFSSNIYFSVKWWTYIPKADTIRHNLAGKYRNKTVSVIIFKSYLSIHFLIYFIIYEVIANLFYFCFLYTSLRYNKQVIPNHVLSSNDIPQSEHTHVTSTQIKTNRLLLAHLLLAFTFHKKWNLWTIQ